MLQGTATTMMVGEEDNPSNNPPIATTAALGEEGNPQQPVQPNTPLVQRAIETPATTALEQGAITPSQSEQTGSQKAVTCNILFY